MKKGSTDSATPKRLNRTIIAAVNKKYYSNVFISQHRRRKQSWFESNVQLVGQKLQRISKEGQKDALKKELYFRALKSRIVVHSLCFQEGQITMRFPYANIINKQRLI